ncbi:hypothetical protein [Rhodococcoides corynebacterioides]|uniref:Uncharacterized protein n=1 Tax=Rhodococcoides corynebacterioides TaxID=53972 RepID=A0ABS7P0Z6_9NOCA|nr:hypothetical protein [Rhodococcus corynebacterioides]MBY6350621.1 hypothetical protein [Rhodococcus corynebacterioides]MBY6366075.1 hypothetical protein [Rhodococcus corynebacterioides]MBY6406967.1 hypothetical protein [Rhodococcus corynebacterioides]
MQRTYPTAVTRDGAGDPDGAQREAVQWIVRTHRDIGGTVLLFLPLKSSLPRSGVLARLALRPGVVVAGSRGRIDGWNGGPVLAAWPTREKLAAIADDARTRALCVIPWNADEVSTWVLVARPVRLDGARDDGTRDASQVLDPVVVQGLTALSAMVNHANNLAGTLDHRDAVAVLKTLHAAGYPLPADEVYVWALSHDWNANGAERLRELTERIDSGRTVRSRGPSPLRADIIDLWRAATEQN